MENQLQQFNQEYGLSTVLTEKEIQTATILYQANQLVSYPIPDHQLEAWSKSLSELFPTMDLELLKRIMRLFKADSLQWDTKKGIQNISNALVQVGGLSPTETIGYTPEMTN